MLFPAPARAVSPLLGSCSDSLSSGVTPVFTSGNAGNHSFDDSGGEEK